MIRRQERTEREQDRRILSLIFATYVSILKYMS